MNMDELIFATSRGALLPVIDQNSIGLLYLIYDNTVARIGVISIKRLAAPRSAV